MKRHIEAATTIIVLLAVALSGTGRAATINVTQVQHSVNGTLDADLTALGETDWVIWDSWSGSTAVSYDRKSGGVGIGALTYSGGAANHGELQAGMQMDYTDGAVNGTGTDVNEGIGRRIGDPSGSPDCTMTLTVNLPHGEGDLTMWLSSDARVLDFFLTAEIGAESVSAENFGPRDYDRHHYEYRVDFTGANPGDTLTLTWEGNGGDYNSSMIMNAAALTAIPEPASALLIVAGLVALCGRNGRSRTVA